MLTLRAFALSLVLIAAGTAAGFAEPQPASTQPAPAATSTTTPTKTPRKFTLGAESESLKLTNDIATAKAQVTEHPDDPEAHFLLGAAYSRSPYLEEAFREIKATKNLLKQKKDFEFIDRTIVSYESLLKANPKDTVVLYRMAMTYYLKAYSVEKYPQHYAKTPVGTPAEYYAKAKTAMEKVIALDPKDIWARNYLGYMISDNGKDLSKAIPVWQASLKVNTDSNPGAYLMLSQAYMKQGDVSKALAYGAKGLEIKNRMGMTLP